MRVNIGYEPTCHDGRHFMSEAEHEIFKKLLTESAQLSAVSYLRDIWTKKADFGFLRHFSFVHWSDPENLQGLLQRPDPSLEISCQAYLSRPYRCEYFTEHVEGVGLVIEGEIGLAGNSDLATNVWEALTIQNGRKYTDVPIKNRKKNSI